MEASTKNCDVCKTPTNKCCKRCKIAYYCSQNCQQQDWKRHKKNCHDADNGDNDDNKDKTIKNYTNVDTSSNFTSGIGSSSSSSSSKSGNSSNNEKITVNGCSFTKEEYEALKWKPPENAPPINYTAIMERILEIFPSTNRKDHPFYERSKSLLGSPHYKSPDFASEYLKYYPKDTSACSFLSECIEYTANTVRWELFLDMDELVLTPDVIAKRWGGALSLELYEFLTDGRIGDVFYNKKKSQYLGVGKQAKSFSNQSKLNVVCVDERNNFAIGVVDLSFLFTLEIRKVKDEFDDINLVGGKKITRIIGFETGAYLVAKTKVILQMMKNDAPASSVIQVWYSSVWTLSTFKDFKDAVRILSMEAASTTTDLDDIISNIPSFPYNNKNSQSEVYKFFTYWETVKSNDKRLKVDKVHEQWNMYFHSASSSWNVCDNLKNERDRVEFARYIFTGEVPLMSTNNAKKNKNKKRSGRGGGLEPMRTDYMRKFIQRSEELIGSVSMFACPSGYEPHNGTELLYNSIPITTILANDSNKISFLDATYSFMESKINMVKKWMFGNDENSSKLEITIYNGSVIQENTKWLHDLSTKLKPYSVIWNNLCDYSTKSDFHKTARSLSCPKTMHFMHSMNWLTEILGSMLLDYSHDERYEYLNAARILIKQMGNIHDKSGYIDYEGIRDHPFNVGSYYTAFKVKDKWIKWYFDGVKGQVIGTLGFYCYFSHAALHLCWSYNENLDLKIATYLKGTLPVPI